MKRFVFAALGVGLVVGSALAQEAKKDQPPAAAPKAKGGAPAGAPGTQAVGKDAAGKEAADPGLASTKQRASYGIAQGQVRGLKAQGIDFDADAFLRGIKDALAEKSSLTDEQIQAALQAYGQELMAKQTEANKAASNKNKQEADAFFAANKKKEGVKALPSGLQYKVLKEGNGPSPKPTDTVSVHYAGRLLDGTEFDSSYKRGQPADINLARVIKGWTEAIPKMKVGSKWELYIPAELGYGEQGSPPVIPPNSALIFDVELLGVQ